MNPVLQRLGLAAINAGTWSSRGGWLADDHATFVESVNPANGEVLARVRATTAAQYEHVLAAAHETALRWGERPRMGSSPCDGRAESRRDDIFPRRSIDPAPRRTDTVRGVRGRACGPR